MGMFDYVEWQGRLPVPRDSRVRNRINPAQTKSLQLWRDDRWSHKIADGGCLTITVTKRGDLIGPDGEHLDWSGKMFFYGDRLEDEFIATFDNGVLTDCKHDPR